jgi:hypothetical protein
MSKSATEPCSFSPATLLLASALAVAGCCTFTKPAATSRFLQLENEHIGFIDAYTMTAGGSQKEWDEAAFQSKVQTINQSFATAASDVGIRYCPARKQFVENSAALFKEDALFIENHHSIGAVFSQNKKEQVKKNYDIFLTK